MTIAEKGEEMVDHVPAAPTSIRNCEKPASTRPGRLSELLEIASAHTVLRNWRQR